MYSSHAPSPIAGCVFLADCLHLPAISREQVTKINPRQAGCDILCVGPRALESSFQGVIRQQDVRATEIDKVLIVESFRPGDVVRACSSAERPTKESRVLLETRVIFTGSRVVGQP